MSVKVREVFVNHKDLSALSFIRTVLAMVEILTNESGWSCIKLGFRKDLLGHMNIKAHLSSKKVKSEI